MSKLIVLSAAKEKGDGSGEPSRVVDKYHRRLQYPSLRSRAKAVVVMHSDRSKYSDVLNECPDFSY